MTIPHSLISASSRFWSRNVLLFPATESDVWSFGVLLWEIFSYGVQPYYGYSNQQVIEMIRNLQLLACPAECPLNIYNLMLQCWNEIPSKRPTFSQLHQRLRNWKAVYSNTMASSLQTASTHSSSLITMNHNLSTSGQYSKTLQHNNTYNHHQHYNSFHLPPPPPLSNNQHYPPTPTHTTYSYSSNTNTLPSSLDHQNTNFNNMNHTHIQQHFNGSSIYGVPFTYDSKMRQASVTWTARGRKSVFFLQWNPLRKHWSSGTILDAKLQAQDKSLPKVSLFYLFKLNVFLKIKLSMFAL